MNIDNIENPVRAVDNFVRREWLNQPQSSWTGSIVAFYGRLDHAKEENNFCNNSFLEIADCMGKVSIHSIYDAKTNDGQIASNLAFVEKLNIIISVATELRDVVARKTIEMQKQ
jgi:hypothetical protein